MKTTTRGISAFNFQRFRQPIRSCGIVLTANQHYGQNLAVTSTNVREFVSGPILVVAVRENVWEPLKLGLISGFHLGKRRNLHTSSNSAPLISISYKESNGKNEVKPMITSHVLKGIPDNANFREGSYNCQDTDIWKQNYLAKRQAFLVVEVRTWHSQISLRLPRLMENRVLQMHLK